MDKTNLIGRFFASLKRALRAGRAAGIAAGHGGVLPQDPAAGSAGRDRCKAGRRSSFFLAFLAALACFLIFYPNYRSGVKLAFPVFFLGALAAAGAAAEGGKAASQAAHKKTETVHWISGLFFALEILMAVLICLRLFDAAAAAAVIKCMSLVLLAAGLAAVLSVRRHGLRWAGVYIICMALILFSCTVLSVLYNMESSVPYEIGQWKAAGCGGIVFLAAFISAVKWEEAM